MGGNDFTLSQVNTTHSTCYGCVSTFQRVNTSYPLCTVTVDGTNITADKDCLLSNGYRSGCFNIKLQPSSSITLTGHSSYGFYSLGLLLATKPTALYTTVNRDTSTVDFSSNKNVLIVGLSCDGTIDKSTFVVTCNKVVITTYFKSNYYVGTILAPGAKTGTIALSGHNISVHIYEY